MKRLLPVFLILAMCSFLTAGVKILSTDVVGKMKIGPADGEYTINCSNGRTESCSGSLEYCMGMCHGVCGGVCENQTGEQ
jgi:hypothetical protein